MRIVSRFTLALCVLAVSALHLAGCQSSGGSSSKSASASDAALSADSETAYRNLLAKEPAAAAIAKDAKAVLVFPKVLKAGFIVGGYHGTGSLIQNDKVTGHYGTTGASYGLQAGIQTYSYALFFMSDSDLSYLDESAGWEVGVGPSITVVDTGLASSLTTTTAKSGVYCFFFDQKGLMAGLGIQGSKITRLDH